MFGIECFPVLISMPPRISSSLRSRLKTIRLFLCDVDGVLTDGSVLMGNGIETKRFNIRDGLGLKFLQQTGIKVGWISRRPSSATKQRADNLGIDFLTQTDSGKVAAIEAILRQTRLNWRDVCFVGDDVVDLGAMERAGVAAAVADGVSEVKAMADYVTRAAGGQGAVREVVELILKTQNKWQAVVSEHAG
jgi:3-deoxy-D-manno-octulosonate 8-phosphate phosphatase (KDO 8-P phosphatase)